MPQKRRRRHVVAAGCEDAWSSRTAYGCALGLSVTGGRADVAIVHVDVQPDYVEKIARRKDPVGAVAELIWNALDADATHVAVDLEVNDLGGVGAVTVTDDGEGMPAASVRTYFERLGGSWKATALRSPGLGRQLHGKSGQGRFRAFALGANVRWTSVGTSPDGTRERTTISAAAARPTDFEISDPVVTDEPPGTTFKSWGGAPAVSRLRESGAIAELTAEFALFLSNNTDVVITVEDQELDPAAVQQHCADYDLAEPPTRGVEATPAPFDPPATVRIIEWAHDVPRALYLCDQSGTVIGSVPAGIQAPGWEFTAYVLWDGIYEHLDDVTLSTLNPDAPVARIIEQAKAAMRDHFKQRDADRRQAQVREWQREQVYPYTDPTDDPIEQTERLLFDQVATSLATRLPSPRAPKRLVLRLIRETLVRQPESMLRLAEELFKLPKREQEELERLLSRTSLAAVVRAAAHVADRLDFLRALKDMVFDPEIKKRVKERAELHRILARELWIFGDEFQLFLANDQSLDTVLKRHLALLGRDPSNLEPVRREDGSTAIVDLALAAASVDVGVRRHLVVELKAPRVSAGGDELQQIMSYAHAVAADPQFRDASVEWDFYLIATKVSDVVRAQANQRDKPPGLVADVAGEVRLRVWVLTWSQIIERCEQRLNYYRTHLEHDPAFEHGAEYLTRVHGDVVPTVVAQRLESLRPTVAGSNEPANFEPGAVGDEEVERG